MSLKAFAVLSTGKGPDWSWEKGRGLPSLKMNLTHALEAQEFMPRSLDTLPLWMHGG